MKRFFAVGPSSFACFFAFWLTTGLMAFALAGPAPALAAGTPDLSKETRACLDCHDKPVMDKTLDDGEILSMAISTPAFVASRHGETDCTDCHSNVDDPQHGKIKKAIKSRRDYAKGMAKSCTDCHKRQVKAYDDGVHSAMVSAGSDKAPVCADCHNPHTQPNVKQLQPIEATPCAKCHTDIFKAYAQDVHGQERAAKGKAAPICSDCHKAHAVKAASLGTGIKDACIACHENAVAQHQAWLPNTVRHFEAISCPACHAPTAKRRVNLRLINASTQAQLIEKKGVPQFEARAAATDAANMGLDERALLSLLKEFNLSGNKDKVVLQGRLEVSSGVEAHQISEKARALKDCDACHRAGAEPFQSVSLTIAGPDGRPLRHGVQGQVLTSLTSIDSVRGFYAIGASRITLLDWLLLLVVLGSISVPVAHMSLKWFVRRRAKPATPDHTAN
jgi:predicted CXXCH cytochrome family protein